MRDHDSAGQGSRRRSRSTAATSTTAFKSAAFTVSQTYKTHYTGSMSIGPECCVADVTPTGARIFTNTQNAYGTRTQIKTVLDKVLGTSMPENRIRLTYYEGSSVYGPAAPYNDANQAAAIMSALSGKPVRLQFMRWDTHGWGNYGPAVMVDIRAGVDAKGNLTAFEFTDFTHPLLLDAGRRAAGDRKPACSRPRAASRRRSAASSTRSRTARSIGKHLPLQNNYFKSIAAAGAAEPADRVRRGAGGRRAGVHGEDGSGRVPAPERRQPDRRSVAALAERAHRGRQGRELAGRRSQRRTSRGPTSSRAAGSRSASTRTR